MSTKQRALFKLKYQNKILHDYKIFINVNGRDYRPCEIKPFGIN